MNIDSFTRSLRKAGEQQIAHAAKLYLAAAERAKESLGDDGQAIVITPFDEPRMEGTQLHVADIVWPNASVKKRFEVAMRDEMQSSS